MTDTSDTKPLDGQLALITGASRGIGAETAIALAAAGAHVVLTGRDVRALEGVEDEIHAFGGNSTIAPLDLAEEDGISPARIRHFRTLGYARYYGDGSGSPPDPHSCYTDKLQELWSGANGKYSRDAGLARRIRSDAETQQEWPDNRHHQQRRVQPRAYWAAYGSTKAAFEGLLDSYGQEVQKISNLRVAILDPGATRTDMRAKAYPGEDPATVKEPSVVADKIVALVQSDFATGHRERVG